MREGNVGVTLSVLYQPFDEMDLTQDYAAPPLPELLRRHRQPAPDGGGLRRRAQRRRRHRALGGGARRATWPTATRPILVHAIEGGFHIGNDPGEVQGNVAQAGRPRRGLHHRGPPVLPPGGDQRARAAVPAPTGSTTGCFTRTSAEGLTAAGPASWCTRWSTRGSSWTSPTCARSRSGDVFALLDERDPGREIPVIATHMAYRFGGLEYSFDDDTVKRHRRTGRTARPHPVPALHHQRAGRHRRDVRRARSGAVSAHRQAPRAHRQL